ncbi:MAG: ABC transporter ATP-binding protein [Chloroflexota bacterium]|nr:ABC transporter ATP-binding protein [Chloroflexota bacterium]
MIQVEGLTKDYGLRRAIDNLTFHAEKGEILGFLGPNGAGKTTTMRILTGFMPPTSGNARVAGFDIMDESIEARRRVGYVPENVPLYENMPVFDYLQYMANLRHLPDVEESVFDVLEQVQMLDRAESYISSLSKGMWQRIGLAQALLHKPDVLILDEPTIGLDPAKIIDVRELVREIGRERTVLLSTHILSEAQQVCDRVLIINKGHIVAEDSPDQLQSRLAGAQRVALRVGGDTDGLKAVVEKVPGVNQVVEGDAHEGGLFEFENAPGQDARPEVARALVSQGYDLLEMKSVGMSLEEIFLKLTRDEPAPLDEGKVDRVDNVEEAESDA